MAKKILLRTGDNEFFDNAGRRFLRGKFDLPCSNCEQNPAPYFTLKSCRRYCDDCVTVLSLGEVFSAQITVEEMREKARIAKEADAKRLAKAQLDIKNAETIRLNLKANYLYTAFMEYHRIHNQYIRPGWADAIEGDKDHFHFMAKQLDKVFLFYEDGDEDL